jgi:UDP-N-acetylglucosamine--N-acetylmuramyl-(pentapeptide) pyrophosphoryl-undecaprenol N-acetylglucosamine transferase
VQRQRLNIVFAGGGTGGHLFPGLAIADEVRRSTPGAEITFIGTRKKIEARVVPQYGFRFEAIWISGFRRRWTVDNLLFPLKVMVSMVQSFLLMWKLKPRVVVGTGGYVCGPPLLAASLLGIPTLIQEQNSYPGVTTRLLAARAKEVHLSFERWSRDCAVYLRCAGARGAGSRSLSIQQPVKMALISKYLTALSMQPDTIGKWKSPIHLGMGGARHSGL